MRLKDNTVNVEDLIPEIRDRLPELDQVYEEFQTELVITSGKDGVHGKNSLHYEGKAIDLRTWNVLDNLVKRIRVQLGAEYDVILEKDHIHIEWDPKHEHVVG